MEGGELMVEVLSLVRTAPRSIVLLPMLLAGLPSLWLQLDLPDEFSYRFDYFNRGALEQWNTCLLSSSRYHMQ